MNRLRILLITAALMTGGSALASAQVYEHGGKAYQNGDHGQSYQNGDRDRGGDRDRNFKRGYDQDDRYRNFDDNRGNRGRGKHDRDDYRKYERRDKDRDRR